MKHTYKIRSLLPALVLSIACFSLSGCQSTENTFTRVEQGKDSHLNSMEEVTKKLGSEDKENAQKDESIASEDTSSWYQGTFVKVGSRIYFRDYAPAGYLGNAAYGQFRLYNFPSYSPWSSESTKLSYYDEATGQIHALCEDNSIGDLIYGNDQFYLTVMPEGAYQVYTLKPDINQTATRQFLTNGRAVGYSPEADCAVIQTWDNDGNTYGTSWRGREQIDSWKIENHIDRMLLSGGYCFYYNIGNPEHDQIDFWCKNLNTKKAPIHLGTLEIDAVKYWCEAEQAIVNGNTIYISTGYKTPDGAQEIFDKGYLLSANLSKADSLNIEQELLTAPSKKLPRIYLDHSERLQVMEHIPGDVWVKNRSLYIQESSGSPELLIRDFLTEMAEPWSEAAEILEKRGNYIYAVRNVQALDAPAYVEQGYPIYDLKKTEYVQIDSKSGEERILESKDIAILAEIQLNGNSLEDGIRVQPMIWIDYVETEKLKQYGIDPEELTNQYACFPSEEPEALMYPHDNLGFYYMTYDGTNPSGMKWVYGDAAQFLSHMKRNLDYGENSMLAYIYSPYRMGYISRIEEVYVP